MVDLDCRVSFQAARDWSENGRFQGLLPQLKSDKPREVLHACMAVTFLCQRSTDDSGEAVLDALTHGITRFQESPFLVAALIKTLGAFAVWAQNCSVKDKLGNRAFTRIFTALEAQPNNELVLLEFAHAMNLVYSAQTGFKHQIDRVNEILFAAAVHINGKVACASRNALCRMTWLSPTLADSLVQRALDEFTTWFEMSPVHHRNTRLVALMELITTVLTKGGCDPATLHERTVGGAKVPCAERDTILNVPLKKCRTVIDAVLDRTLHNGLSVEEIRKVPAHDTASLGHVFEATLRLAQIVVRIGSLPLVMERKWLTKLVLSLASNQTNSCHRFFTKEIGDVHAAIIHHGYGVVFGAPLRQLEEFILNLLDCDELEEPKAKRAKKPKVLQDWRKEAFHNTLRLWNALARSPLMQKVDPKTAARVHEIVVRVLWTGCSVAHSGIESSLCEYPDEMLDALEVACEQCPELRKVGLGVSRSVGEKGRRVYERLWKMQTVHGPGFSRAYTEALNTALTQASHPSCSAEDEAVIPTAPSDKTIPATAPSDKTIPLTAPSDKTIPLIAPSDKAIPLIPPTPSAPSDKTYQPTPTTAPFTEAALFIPRKEAADTVEEVNGSLTTPPKMESMKEESVVENGIPRNTKPSLPKTLNSAETSIANAHEANDPSIANAHEANDPSIANGNEACQRIPQSQKETSPCDGSAKLDDRGDSDSEAPSLCMDSASDIGPEQ